MSYRGELYEKETADLYKELAGGLGVIVHTRKVTPTPKDKRVEEITTARQSAYGPPMSNHRTTAEMYEAWKIQRRTSGLDAIDVCAFNIMQKLSRLAWSPDHRDSLDDIKGYVDNWIEIIEENS